MLKISPAVTVTRVPGSFQGQTDKQAGDYTNNYILFPDSEQPNQYYALAESPTFLADGKGDPSVNLTWYFGSGVPAGAICSMTVALPTPDLSNPAVKDRILSALCSDQLTIKTAKMTHELCLALAANDAARITQLKADLGLDDKTAAARKSSWSKDRGWEQFLPQGDGLQIHPIDFKTGTVTVKAFANKDAYQAQDSQFAGTFETTPSLFNSNAAVVTFNLSDLGANLFWHALGGPPLREQASKPEAYSKERGGSSVISVRYQVTFDGQLPAAKATVTLKHEVLAKLDMETLVKNGSWGRTYRQEVVRGKEYNDAINSATEIFLPAVASKEDKDNVQKLLTDWAAKQLEDMAKAQFPQVNLGDLNPDNLRKMKAVQEQSRTYKLTQAVTVPKQPQALLPKVDGIVGEGALKKFFQLIDLNEVPYVNVGLTIRPPNAGFLQARNVERFVVTQLTYADQKLLAPDGKEVGSIEYLASAQQAANVTYKGTFGRSNNDRAVRYGYLVSYTDGTPSFRAPLLSQPDDNYLDLGGVDIGVLSVKINTIDLPWDVLSSAEIVLKYDNWEKAIVLTNSAEPQLVTKAFGKAMDKTLSYRVKLNPTTGAPVTGDFVQVPLERGQADISLRSPLGSRTSQVTFQLDGAVEKAQLRVEYLFRSNGPDRIFNQLIQLERGKATSVDWNVPVDDDKPSALRVVKARVTAGGTSTDLQDLSGGVQDPVTQGVIVTVYPGKLDTF